jgi:hypothetical protein
MLSNRCTSSCATTDIGEKTSRLYVIERSNRRSGAPSTRKLHASTRVRSAASGRITRIACGEPLTARLG